MAQQAIKDDAYDWNQATASSSKQTRHNVFRVEKCYQNATQIEWVRYLVIFTGGRTFSCCIWMARREIFGYHSNPILPQSTHKIFVELPNETAYEKAKLALLLAYEVVPEVHRKSSKHNTKMTKICMQPMPIIWTHSSKRGQQAYECMITMNNYMSSFC